LTILGIKLDGIPITLSDDEKRLRDFVQAHENIRGFVEKYNNTEFKRGPTVDLSILKEYELKYSGNGKVEYNTTMPNLNLFYSEILNHPTFADKKNIIIFSHGSLIRNIIKLKNYAFFEANKDELKHMMNTQIIKETTNRYNQEFNFEILKNAPKIRSTYQDFEVLNEDVCRLESVKGYINYSREERQQKYGNKYGNKYDTIRDIDIRSETPHIIRGGNRNLKYKINYQNQ
jgi:hypothetical protein